MSTRSKQPVYLRPQRETSAAFVSIDMGGVDREVQVADDCVDPGMSMNCPRCGAPLRFVATKPGVMVHLYACDRDGPFVITANDLMPIPLPNI